MKKTILYFALLFSVGVLTSCAQLLPANYFRAAPDETLNANFSKECYSHFDFSQNSEADGGKCDELRECLSREMLGTPLSTYDAWPTIEKMMPRLYGYPTLIPELQKNAEAAGPKAVEMFHLIADIRQHCLIETGLDQLMPIY